MPTMSTPAAPSQAIDAWPPEVELILSALEAAGNAHDERRSHERIPYRVLAELRLYSDPPAQPLWQLYSRDVSVRGMGFITPHQLPLGYGGVVQIPTPRTGRLISVAGTLFRCREVSSGWFEGSLYFNREQWIFSPET
jgi:hypothetical protein